MMGSEKNRKVAAGLALLGAFQPTPLPLSGLHKFYLGQPVWGILYLLLGWTQIPRIASAIEGIWYLSHSDQGFGQRFLASTVAMTAEGRSSNIAAPPQSASANALPAEQVGAIANALRELDRLRQEGLISEYEFEQKRRSLLDQLG
ncbi:MAG: NINE protein [Cyanobacteria bacterium J06635_15]